MQQTDKTEYWKEIISECQNRSSKMTIEAWCLNKGINKNTLSYWKKRLRKLAAKTMPDTAWISLPLSDVSNITVNSPVYLNA